MFRIVCDPSSGSIKLYLTEIRSGSLKFFVCLVCVWQRNFEPVVCAYGPTDHTHTNHWFKITLCVCVCSVGPYAHITGSKFCCQTPIKHTKNISELLRISVKYSILLPDDGSRTIRNMPERSLIFCLLKFLYNIDFSL